MRMRNRNLRRYILEVVIIILFVVIVFFIYQQINNVYMEKKQVFYQKKEAKMFQFIEYEKEWIKENQGSKGEIYLNIVGQENGALDVNPYFACLGAKGLLAGNVSDEDLRAVASYLSWNAEVLIENEGVVSNYRYIENKLEPTGSYDSVDAYLAVFLSLYGDYAASGGSIDDIPNGRRAVELAVWKLTDLTQNGLTKVSEDNQTYYLMDNVEVHEALLSLETMLQTGPEAFYLQVKNLRKECANAIKNGLWNEERQRYEIGNNADGSTITFQGYEQIYPDALAQIYPMVCGYILDTGQEEDILFQTFYEYYDWTQDRQEKEILEWPVVAYAAVTQGEIEVAENYLEQYRQIHENNREYPFHIADAAWAARAASQLINSYKEAANISLKNDLRNGNWRKIIYE